MLGGDSESWFGFVPFIVVNVCQIKEGQSADVLQLSYHDGKILEFMCSLFQTQILRIKKEMHSEKLLKIMQNFPVLHTSFAPAPCTTPSAHCTAIVFKWRKPS